MTEDRFEDLTTGEKLARRDETHPEPVKPPEVPRPGNKYAWLVGILMLMGLGVLLFAQTLPNSGEALFGLKRGDRLPDFAVPLVTGPIEGDANICQEEPCPEGSGERPACELRSSDVLNICELRQEPLVLTFIFDRGADCYPQVDRIERVRGDVNGVRFATVYFSRKERSELQSLVEQRRWSQPIGVDQDGEVSNRYGVGVCPTTMFVREGGVVLETKLGNLTEDQIRRNAERLVQ